MNINAKYFGDISYEKEEVIHIINGLFGFEDFTEYLPISFNGENDKMISLQSIENETLSFILMNPFELFPDYNPLPSKQDLQDLGTDTDDDISYYVVCVIRDSADESTVNLKAPLAVNAITRQAKQVIIENPEYGFRHTLKNLVHKNKEES